MEGMEEWPPPPYGKDKPRTLPAPADTISIRLRAYHCLMHLVSQNRVWAPHRILVRDLLDSFNARRILQSNSIDSLGIREDFHSKCREKFLSNCSRSYKRCCHSS